MRIGFRVDAAAKLGGGHVMRCLTLADQLRSAGHQCQFFCSQETLDVIPETIWDGFPVEVLAQNALPGGPETFDVMIIDHYGMDRESETRWRAHARFIAVIDDLADRPHDCDLLIDQNFNRSPSDYSSLVPQGTAMLTGPRYALLRGVFAALRRQSIEQRADAKPVRRLLVSLGMTDVGGITWRVCEALAKLPDLKQVDVVVGEKTQSHARIKKLAETDGRFNVHGFVRDMASLMVEADAAVGAGGTTTWERCAMGLPSLVLVLAGNQRESVKALDDAGAIVSLGDATQLSDTELKNAISDALKELGRLYAAGIKSAEICDGAGAARAVKELEALVQGGSTAA